MTKAIAAIIAIVSLSLIGAVCVILIVSFKGNDTTLLIAAILGFLTPTIGSMLTLLQASNNAQATAGVASQVESVNQKVNGHLTRLTQIVVDSAARNEPVTPVAAALLAQKTEVLTGNTIVTPQPKPVDGMTVKTPVVNVVPSTDETVKP